MKDHRQVYLIGNPVVWWSSTIAVGIYIALRALLVLREKRGFRDLHQRESAVVTPEGEIADTLSQDWLLRRSLRFPRRLVGAPLLPLLPHATSALPTSLPPRIVLCRTLLLRRIRLYDLLAPTSDEDTGSRCGLGLDGMVVDLLFTFDLRPAMDEGQV